MASKEICGSAVTDCFFQVDQGCHPVRCFGGDRYLKLSLSSGSAQVFYKNVLEGSPATQGSWLPQRLTPQFLVSSNTAITCFTSGLGSLSMRVVLLVIPEILKSKKTFTDLLRDAKAALELLVQKRVPP